MYFILAGIIILGIVAATIGYVGDHRRNRQNPTGIENATDEKASPLTTCCGQHEVCERDSLLASVSQEIDYYNDEELDEYQGTASDEYTEAAIEEFREVFYTLRETEVAGWLRSLQLRNLNLPDQLKDEALLIVGERRTG